MEHRLHPHLADHVGMGADEDASLGDLTQDVIKRVPALARRRCDRVHPDQDTVHAQQLNTEVVGRLFAEHGRFGGDALPRQGRKDRMEAIVVRGGGCAIFQAAAPDDGDLESWWWKFAHQSRSRPAQRPKS